MDSDSSAGDMMPPFYVGHHELERTHPYNDQLVQMAQDCGYDMISTPITTKLFHSSVLSLLSSYKQAIQDSRNPHLQPLPLIPALRPVDTTLTPSATIAQIVAYTSSWIDLASPDPLIAHLSRQVLQLEIAYAAFCGVVTVVVQGPRLSPNSNITQYARALKEVLSVGPYVQIHVNMPMVEGGGEGSDRFLLSNFAEGGSASSEEHEQPGDGFCAWNAWSLIRAVCKYHSRLSLALNLPRKLPSPALQSRWYSEPIRLLTIPASSFVTNARGSFVLSKAHQYFVFRLMRLRSQPWILLSEIGPVPGVGDPNFVMDLQSPSESRLGALSPDPLADTPSPSSSMSASPTPAEAARMKQSKKNKSKDDPTPHLSYMRYLQRNQPTKSMLERFGGGFQDYLQSPLQPLADNLESITYEVFEKDPIKYDWYERAIEAALRDWHFENKSTSSPTGAVVIAVVGSGRGPLVTRALRASENSGVPVQVFAIEKNPNAYVLLQRHNDEDWNDLVTIVKTDMRAWKGPTLPDGTFGHVDILVSELLGSFADNELSPECLDGVQHVLNPDNGISIPASYTAHLTPIATPKIHTDLIYKSNNSEPAAFEIPWVVMLQQMDYLSTTGLSAKLPESHTKMCDMNLESPLTPYVQTAWSFSHPVPASVIAQSALRRGGAAMSGGGGFTGGDGANEHNSRFVKLTFPIQEQGACHGLAGFFETVLYEAVDGTKVELSTNPVTMDQKSKDMISWFPIFFPLKAPIQLPPNSELDVSMWRLTDDRKVWYEWLVEAFITVEGRRLMIGVSDLHSTKTNGCLM